MIIEHIVNHPQVVTEWWAQVEDKITLFLDVMLHKRAITDHEIDAARRYLAQRQAYIEQLPAPTPIDAIQQDLLAALDNLNQHLHYRQQDDSFAAQTRYQRAMINVDSLRYRLLKYRIML